MPFDEFVRKVISELNGSGLEYALTGRLAAGHDAGAGTEVDALVRLRRSMLGRLAVTLQRIGFGCETDELEKVWASKYRVASFATPEGYRLGVVLTHGVMARTDAVIFDVPTYVLEPGAMVLDRLASLRDSSDEASRQDAVGEVLFILKNAELDIAGLKDAARRQRTSEILEEMLAQAEEAGGE